MQGSDVPWVLLLARPIPDGGLGLRETTIVHPAAFLGCCAATRDLVGSLLGSGVPHCASGTLAASSPRVATTAASSADLRLPGEDVARDSFLNLLPAPPDLDLASSR